MSAGRWLGVLLVGVPLGLATTELVVAVSRDWAFPHVNFYVPDEKLGVRLAPHATESISFSGNPVTRLRTNSAGYRGGEWGPPEEPAVLIVGDSQVFGLGVEEADTAAAVMAERLGRPVLNGGVPTYGPDEYLAVVEEIGASRVLSDIVVVINASNDFFEASRPNVSRHGAWDGWAIRKENLPTESVDFPGRRWLFSRSHAVFAWRAMHYDGGAPAPVASEGDARDLLPIASAQRVARAGEQVRAKDVEARLTEQVHAALLSARNDGSELGLLRALSYVDTEVERSGLHVAAVASLEGRAVGEVVFEPFAESSRKITLTAELLADGAKIRREAPQRLRAWLAAHPDAGYETEMVREALHALEVAAGRASVSAGAVAVPPEPHSVLSAFLARAQTVAAAEGARLTVVLLPLDVQVSESEWAKYDSAPIDMSGSLVLLDEVAEEADRLGISVVQPLEALRAAQPGAFLDGDLHLSPKGQRTLGEGIAAVLRGPPPVKIPTAPAVAVRDQVMIVVLPEGRSRVPLAEEWGAVREIVVRGSSALGCETSMVREWVRVRCRAEGVGDITPVDVPLETWITREPGSITLQAPLLEGRAVVADFVWADHAARLTLDAAGRRFEPVAPPATPPRPLDLPRPGLDGCVAPPGWIGEPGRGCASIEACDARLACADGRRSALPVCGVGEANAGAAGHCFVRCDADHPCGEGVCTPWLGTGMCL